VIYTIYDDHFKETFKQGFEKKLKLPGITAKDSKYYKDTNYVNLTKAAIDYSDAVIIGSEKIDPELDEYVSNLKKPVLEYQKGTDYIDVFNGFYDKLLG